MFHAEFFRPYADRMAPAAVIPMHTPGEAIAELEHAVRTLGFKAVLLPGHVWRPIAAVARTASAAARRAFWLDTFCVDSAHDYDPVWRTCVELRVAPTFHSDGMGWGSRTSVSKYMSTTSDTSRRQPRGSQGPSSSEASRDASRV